MSPHPASPLVSKPRISREGIFSPDWLTVLMNALTNSSPNTFNPRDFFQSFYTNPAISALAGACRWTVSGVIGEMTDEATVSPKAPLDIRHWAATKGIRGAYTHDETCLMTLDELTEAMPNATNAAFYLNATSDGYVVIDCEPSCPPAISDQLLGLSDIIYAEVSMSGRGYHLITPLPSSFLTQPQYARLPALRHPRGWFEILLHHWITFTRHPAPHRPTPGLSLTSTPLTIDDVYRDLTSMITVDNTTIVQPVDTESSVPQIIHADDIIRHACEDSRPRIRQLSDFDNDASRWEFSCLGVIYRAMEPWLIAFRTPDHPHTASDRAWLLYHAARQVIPWRPKHDSTRHGRPYLLDRAATLVADRLNSSASPSER